jgi:hypothetical protein
MIPEKPANIKKAVRCIEGNAHSIQRKPPVKYILHACSEGIILFENISYGKAKQNRPSSLDV